MSTTTTIPRPPVAPPALPVAPFEERGVMHDVSWDLYDRLTDAIAERSSIRVAFDGKDVEVMVAGPFHEGIVELLGLFVGEVCDGLDLEFHGLGRTTWKRDDVKRGVEADLSYCFEPAKVAACLAAHAVDSNDGAALPIPDLAVEVDISPPELDRNDIYSKLRAPELWRFSDDVVSIDQLDASGSYVAAEASRFLYVRADEVTHWLRQADSMGQLAWKRLVRDWARAVLRPRAGL